MCLIGSYVYKNRSLYVLGLPLCARAREQPGWQPPPTAHDSEGWPTDARVTQVAARRLASVASARSRVVRRNLE